MPDSDVTIRPLQRRDLADADRIMRVAFGTHKEMQDPASFMGDADYVRSRWAANPDAAFAAEVDGRVVGTNFAIVWGSFGFFGPLSIDPEFWGRGIAQALMVPR